MPPHRRRPAPSTGQAPPIRRPKVAGLRNRSDREDSPSTERVTGVLNGLRGTPPTRRDDEAETTVLPRVTDEDVTEPDDSTDSTEVADSADEAVATTDVEIDPETNEPPAITDDSSDGAADGAVTKVRPKRAVKPLTRPAGKRRATGTARPSDLAEAEAESTDRGRHAKSQDRPARTKAQTQMSVAIILVVIAVILAGLAVYFRGEANDLTSGDTSNTALTDSAATSQLKGQLTNAIKQTFSYNYTDLASTEKAVKESLTGKALCEYNLLFDEVKKQAPQQKSILDTTVRELGIVRIDGDRAEALVYIDQLSTRVDLNKTVAVGGQFGVEAKKYGDHWKITKINMFGQPLVNGKPAPTC